MMGTAQLADASSRRNSQETAVECRTAGSGASRYASAPRKRRSFADDSPEVRYQNTVLGHAAQRRIREARPKVRVLLTGGFYKGRTGIRLRKNGNATHVLLDNGMTVYPRTHHVAVIG